jgi:methionyl aminopeptidase
VRGSRSTGPEWPSSGRSIHGHAVCAARLGHGIGRRIHEAPEVASGYVPELTEALTEGLVLTIEPIISAGSGTVRHAGDAWTARADDGSTAAPAEPTIVITADAPPVLTA